MLYIDTSVLVALHVRESSSPAVLAWYAAVADKSDLVSATWCVTEFGSALGLKLRTAQINEKYAQEAWKKFQSLMNGDLRLLPMEQDDFHQAALLTLDAESGIRAGDALHLNCAQRSGARQIATLDAVMARNARRLKIKPVDFGV